jgi:hypothetical protein
MILIALSALQIIILIFIAVMIWGIGDKMAEKDK